MTETREISISPAPLVCGVDFSPESRHALIYAAALAARLGCGLHVVSAVEPLLAEAARLRHRSGTFFDDVARDLREFAERLPLPVALAPERVSYEALDGDTAPVLLDAATRRNARLIVVGTRGRGQVARTFLGSTTLRLLRVTTIPVLVTDWDDSSDVPGAAARAEVSRLICGVDFSAGARAAVGAAVRLAMELRAGLTLVHAVPPAVLPTGWDGLVRDIEGDWIKGARTQLEAMAQTLPMTPLLQVRVGSPSDVLAAETTNDPQAIVVVALRGAAAHRPGSTALRIVTLVQTPVLAVPL